MAWHRLAEQMGAATVEEAQGRCDSRQFSGWLAYWSVSPPLPERLDWLFGLMTWWLMSCWVKEPPPLADLTADFAAAARGPRSKEEVLADAQERVAAKLDRFAAGQKKGA